MTLAIFSDLAPVRKREASSAIAHYIAGVLDRESMVQIVESLCETASFQVGDRVKTLRGSTRGKIIRLLEDGRVLWQPAVHSRNSWPCQKAWPATEKSRNPDLDPARLVCHILSLS